LGDEKDRAIQQDEQGWQFSPGVDLCHKCLADNELARHIRDHEIEYTATSVTALLRKPSCIPLDDLIEIIGETLAQYYDRAVNALSWDGEDGE
jgi:hypothetical protein